MIGTLVYAWAFWLWSFLRDGIEHTHPLFYIFVPYWVLILAALFLSPVTVILPQLIQRKLTWPKKEDIPDEWIINGKRYNLKPLYSSHPGGEQVLRAARGSDCTGLVESYHVFIDREVYQKMLARYEIKDERPEEPVRMRWTDPFYEDLKLSVREHFKGKGRGAHKMTWERIALCALAGAAMWVCIYLMLFENQMWTMPCIGFLSWYLTGNVMHDASHNAFVTQPWLNRILSRAAFPYGVNVASWQIQHVMSHHIYTNDVDDVDLYHFDPLIVLEKSKGGFSLGLAWHALRLVYLLSSAIPHLCFIVPYGLLFGQVDPAHGHRTYDRVKAVDAHRAELRWEIIGEMVAQIGFWFVCYMQHGFVKAICCQMSVFVFSSYFFCFFTQVSHLQEDCFVKPEVREKLSFAERQVTSSMDFAADSPFWGHVSGGLNTQAIHHCFPGISAMHLRALYPRFREVCRRHNVVLKEAPSLRDFLVGFVSYAN